jgi:uncharacterized protein YceK
MALLSGCASTTSSSSSSEAGREGTKSNSTYSKVDGKGFETFWTIIGMALLMGIVFKTAPKEAYRN